MDTTGAGLDAEVIVVGGGPAGSATAALLARAGHDVVLLDRARFPRPKACAEYLSPATADVLARMGALAAVEAARPERPWGMRLMVGHQPERARRPGAASANPRAEALVRYPDAGGERRALCLPREVLDATLLDHARACGVRVMEGAHVSDAAAGVKGVTLTVRGVESAAAEARTMRARLLIGADGARSIVARCLGVTRRPIWPRRVGFVSRFSRTPGLASLTEWGEMHVGHGAYCGLAPLPGGAVYGGLVRGVRESRNAAADGGGTEAAFAEGLRRIPGAEKRLDGAVRLTPIRGVAPLAARVSRPVGDGFLLVGDAAGFLDPFTGEGVFRALRGAELAAEVAHDALAHGDVSGAALARYTALRRREFAAKTALTWLIQVLLVSPPLLAYALRRIQSRPVYGAELGAVLGDYRPAEAVLGPRFLWGLLRP
jgi:menaquinone-9 beta-reductase